MVVMTLVHAGGKVPCYMTKGAAAADVFLPADVTINPGEIKKIPLNISFDIREGYQVLMFPRSSLLVKRHLIQPVSIIDSDYKGIVHVPIANIGNEAVELKEGERLAQVEVHAVNKSNDWETINAERDQNGFGGTGK